MQTGIVSRGFFSRRSPTDVRLPPGQYLITEFPALSAGATPRVPLDRWKFTIDDGTDVLRRWDWKSFRDLPAETITADLLCVSGTAALTY
jgi:DMSO/TMAO reductase YedYZ molybdopterin-dependent catalytic subunit